MRLYSAEEFGRLIRTLPKLFYVYTLVVRGKPFYVGKGFRDSACVRALAHRKEATSKDDPKSRFLRRLWSKGEEELYRLDLMCNSEITAFFHEQVLIADYGRRIDGGPLFNKAIGGQGSSGYSPSAETRKRMSKTRTGRRLSLDHCKAISAGRLVSERVRSSTRRRMIPVRINGKAYPCAGDAASALGINRSTLVYRLGKWKGYEAIR